MNVEVIHATLPTYVLLSWFYMFFMSNPLLPVYMCMPSVHTWPCIVRVRARSLMQECIACEGYSFISVKLHVQLSHSLKQIGSGGKLNIH